MPMGCGLVARAAMWAPAVRGVIESMNSARFIHERLEEDVGLDREALAARVDPGERVAAVAVRVPSRPRYRTTAALLVTAALMRERDAGTSRSGCVRIAVAKPIG
jgi:hypothetical protein